MSIKYVRLLLSMIAAGSFLVQFGSHAAIVSVTGTVLQTTGSAPGYDFDFSAVPGEGNAGFAQTRSIGGQGPYLIFFSALEFDDVVGSFEGIHLAMESFRLGAPFATGVYADTRSVFIGDAGFAGFDVLADGFNCLGTRSTVTISTLQWSATELTLEGSFSSFCPVDPAFETPRIEGVFHYSGPVVNIDEPGVVPEPSVLGLLAIGGWVAWIGSTRRRGAASAASYL